MAAAQRFSRPIRALRLRSRNQQPRICRRRSDALAAVVVAFESDGDRLALDVGIDLARYYGIKLTVITPLTEMGLAYLAPIDHPSMGRALAAENQRFRTLTLARIPTDVSADSYTVERYRYRKLIRTLRRQGAIILVGTAHRSRLRNSCARIRRHRPIRVEFLSAA
jgi:hypothetical protein